MHFQYRAADTRTRQSEFKYDLAGRLNCIQMSQFLSEGIKRIKNS